MTIQRVEVFRLSQPVATPMGPSGATYSRRQAVLVKLRDGDGVDGWGETYARAGVAATIEETGRPAGRPGSLPTPARYWTTCASPRPTNWRSARWRSRWTTCAGGSWGYRSPRCTAAGAATRYAPMPPVAGTSTVSTRSAAGPRRSPPRCATASPRARCASAGTRHSPRTADPGEAAAGGRRRAGPDGRRERRLPVPRAREVARALARTAVPVARGAADPPPRRAQLPGVRAPGRAGHRHRGGRGAGDPGCVRRVPRPYPGGHRAARRGDLRRGRRTAVRLPSSPRCAAGSAYRTRGAARCCSPRRCRRSACCPSPRNCRGRTRPLLEFDRFDNPMRTRLAPEPFAVTGGRVDIPTGPGLGITVDDDFIRHVAA